MTETDPHVPGVLRHNLPNVLRILAEPMPQVRSVSLGIWLDAGSRR